MTNDPSLAILPFARPILKTEERKKSVSCYFIPSVTLSIQKGKNKPRDEKETLVQKTWAVFS
uniref:Uncharacterized protein n=1 Tax=Arundo donax TaxID=35708 RepID=A0A0A9CLL0_ARUDO